MVVCGIRPARRGRPRLEAAEQDGPAGLRRIPRQARGIATVDAIIEAAAALIEQVGHEALTTNLIAKAADVNIASLYQYFSSKQAVIAALYERQTTPRHALVLDHMDRIRRGEDWREMFNSVIRTAWIQRQAQIGAGAVRLAIRASPELQAREQELGAATMKAGTEAILAFSDLPRAKAERVARTTLGMIVNGLDDLVNLHRDLQERMVEELAAAAIAYLSLYARPTA
jgi:AcrR family transcriptional regulator